MMIEIAIPKEIRRSRAKGGRGTTMIARIPMIPAAITISGLFAIFANTEFCEEESLDGAA
jgi:hypothetical protein